MEKRNLTHGRPQMTFTMEKRYVTDVGPQLTFTMENIMWLNPTDLFYGKASHDSQATPTDLYDGKM